MSAVMDSLVRLKLLLCLLAVAGIFALTGCASVPEQAGFTDVAQVVSERIDQRVQWNQDAPEDKAVDEAVDTLLQDTLTGDEAVQIALLNNRQLQATYEDLGLAQANLVQAGLLANPIFNAGILFPVSGSAAELDFGITQSFLSILYRPLRRQIAAAALEATKLQITGEVLGLAAQVRAAFYRTQANEQLLELLRRITAAAQASAYTAERLHEAGNITALDLHREQAFYESARMNLAEAQARLTFGRERLNAVMGLWGMDTQWKVKPRLPEIAGKGMSMNGLEKQAIEASLDLSVTRTKIVSAGQVLGLTNANALIPALDTTVSSERREGDWELGPTLALPIPLFDQGQARLAAARSELRRARQLYWAQAVQIRAFVRAAWQEMSNAQLRALHVRNVVLPLRTRIVNETQLQYNAMQVGVFQVLLAKQQQISTAVQYIKTLRDYWLARTQFEQILQGHTTQLADAAMGQAVALSDL
jgi:outer membrane protein, heavy metal efflux system